MYVWMSVAHIATPPGAAGISTITAEQPLLTAMTAVLGNKPGLYMFPAFDEGPDAMEKYGKKLAASPSELLIYQGPGAQPMTPA